MPRKLRFLPAKCLLMAFALIYFAPILLIACGSVMPEGQLQELFGSFSLWGLIPSPVTLKGYDQLLIAQTAYLKTFWNSALLCAVIVAGQCALSAAVSFAIWRRCLPGGGLVLAVCAFVMLLPFQVTMLPNYIQIRRLGLYNTLWALILPGVFSPLGVFLTYQFMKDMPQEIVEAALMDTSSPARILLYIVTPNVAKALGALALITFAENWNLVEQPLIFIKDAWKYPLSLTLSQAEGEMNGIFAGAVVYMLPIYFLFRMFGDSLLDGLERIGTR